MDKKLNAVEANKRNMGVRGKIKILFCHKDSQQEVSDAIIMRIDNLDQSPTDSRNKLY